LSRLRLTRAGIVLALAAIAGATACEKSVNVNGPGARGGVDGDWPQTPIGDAVPNPAMKMVAPVLVTINNQFAIDLFHKLNPGDSANCFFSPFSISSALAMTWAGARGETAAQMASALRFSKVADKDVTPGFNYLEGTIGRAQARSGAQLSVANSLWPEQDPEHPFLPEYLELLHRDFGTAVTPVDFKNGADKAAQRINDWVEQKTHNKIKNVLQKQDVKADTRMVLVNAIYFKGVWEHKFEPEKTEKHADFHAADGAKQHVDLMTNTAWMQYADIKDGPVPCQVLAMDYFDDGKRQVPPNDGSGVSMVVVLPRAVVDLAMLEKNLTAEQLSGWLGGLDMQRVEVHFPKFRIQQRCDLGAALKSLGMGDAFSEKAADFSGMDGAHDLVISKVIHQAFVDVDEKGTEAAAATAVEMTAPGAAAPLPPQMFRADHPFLFLIRENRTGSILFLWHFASANGN